MQWCDFTGGRVPDGTTHLQLEDGTVIERKEDREGRDILRYYGPPQIPPLTDPVATAHEALAALLKGEKVVISHPPGYQRLGFPLPYENQPTRPDGSCTQNYRPIVVLEYIDKLMTPKRVRK